MRVIHSWKSTRLSGVVMAVGNFDGVHRGHQTILARGRERADQAGGPLVAMTFDPHPLAVLTPGHIPPTLTPLGEKLHWLEKAGVDLAVVIKTNHHFLHMTPDKFITDVILKHFEPAAMVEGSSFRFGCKRQGNVEMLADAGRERGFEVEVIPPVRVDLGGNPDMVISSSLVRQLLRSGTVDQAALCLGRPYALVGMVEHGAGRGQRLGIPTANIRADDQLIPAEGVYAGRARIGGETYVAAVSIGRTPTFKGKDLIVEAHLLDYVGDLYNQRVRLEMIDWLRPQESYATSQALCEQMERDVARVRERVSADPPAG